MKLLDETIEIAINSIPYRSVCMIFTPRKNFEIAFEKKKLNIWYHHWSSSSKVRMKLLNIKRDDLETDPEFRTVHFGIFFDDRIVSETFGIITSIPIRLRLILL